MLDLASVVILSSTFSVEDADKRKDLSTWAVIQQIIRDEGIASLYRGIGPTLESLCISNFVYFYTFHSLKAVFSPAGDKNASAIKDLLLASIAGAINVLSTTPFWVVNTRLKMKGIGKENSAADYDTLIQGLMTVAKKEGVRGLWSGTIPSLILVSNPAIQFMMYEMIKRNIQKVSKSNDLSSLTVFLMGAVSKAIATVVTYPLQLVQTRQRHSAKTDARKLSMAEIIEVIVRTQGAYGLFRGLEAKILQTVSTAALMFVIYEKVATYVRLVLKPSAL